MPFKIAPKNYKLIYINLVKHVQDLYDENYKILTKEIKDLNIWREIACSWVGRHNKKMSILN